MKSRSFVLYTSVIAVGYLVFSLSYFSQMYLLYGYFTPDAVYSIIMGWAYVAQAVGMALFSLLYRRWPVLFSDWGALAFVFGAGAAVQCAAVFIPGAGALVAGTVVNNLLIGASTGITFALAAARVEKAYIGRCFAVAYAFGSVFTWALTLVDAKLLTSFVIIPVSVALFGLAVALARPCGGLPDLYDAKQPAIPDAAWQSGGGMPLWRLAAVLLLMAAVSSLGSNAYSVIAADA